MINIATKYVWLCVIAMSIKSLEDFKNEAWGFV